MRGQQPTAKLGWRVLNLTGSRSVSRGRSEATESLPRLPVWKLLRTLLELELFACVVIVLRHFVELFPLVYRGTGTLLLIAGHLLKPCYIVVDADVQRGPSARRSPGVS